jgi:glycosyltransferase involved in cell wall biosynthesis
VSAKVHISVVIPTRNGGSSLEPVLAAVFAQECPSPFEVVVIDSGSTDDTLDIVARHPCRVLQIPPASFDHGDTRNRGVSEARGDIIAFLTQDARPADRHWLANLAEPFDLWADVAGAFGRHVAHPGADPLIAARIDRVFLGFGAETAVFRRPADSEYRRRADFYDFFSNNNSAIRRSAWCEHPFPRTMMAEDQRWARIVMARGWAKAYVPGAVVHHSHDYTAAQWFRRAFDEARAGAEMRAGESIALPSALRRFVGGCVHDARALATLPRASRLRLVTRSVARNAAEAAGSFAGRHETLFPPGVRARLTLQQTGRR